jgi:hypothetical protein
MNIRNLTAFAVIAVLLIANVGFADVTNGGFETDDSSGGDSAGASAWSGFSGSGFTSSQSASPFEGVNVFKIFGPFDSQPDEAGIFQDLAASAGQVWTASAQVQHWAGDAMQGDTFGAVQLQFFDGGGTQLGSTLQSSVVDAATTQDQWNLLSISGTAPTGTADARILLVHAQPTGGDFGGSAFFDSASLVSAVPEPSSLTVLGLGAIGFLSRRRRS